MKPAIQADPQFSPIQLAALQQISAALPLSHQGISETMGSDTLCLGIDPSLNQNGTTVPVIYPNTRYPRWACALHPHGIFIEIIDAPLYDWYISFNNPQSIDLAIAEIKRFAAILELIPSKLPTRTR